MLKILLRKQMTELYRGFFYDQKKNKARSKLSSALFISMYVILMVVILGGMFTLLSISICSPLVSSGMGWLYFGIISTIAIALGIFGSVFNTYSALYLAKDNDLLLSLPIPVKYILISRLFSVYILGLMFSALSIVPGVIVYNIVAGATAMTVIGGIMFLLSISLVVLILSCALGWVVAKVSLKLKNKSFITVFLSLLFFAAYYFVYFKANEVISHIIENAASIGDKIKGSAYPIYIIGRSAEGDLLSILLFFAITAVILFVVLYIIAHGFIKIATSSGSSAKTKYVEKTAKKNSIFGAMLGKEFARFTASPNYMLNCGFGIIFLPIAGVLIFIKGSDLASNLAQALGDKAESFIPVLFCAALCTLASMNDMAAPSVSLEGKNIWIAQSLPINAWVALKAKLYVQIILTTVPASIFIAAYLVKMNSGLLSGILVVIFSVIYIFLSALFGLFVGLKKPNLSWTNEIYPIKQSLGVMLAIFGSWGFAVIMVAAYLFLSFFVSATLFIAIFSLLSAILAFVLYRWIKIKGSKIFSEL